MLRRRTLVAGVITLLFLLFSNSLWLVKKPVDLEFNLEGVDSVKISYKLSDGIFNSKTVSKDFDLKKSSKIKINNEKLYFKKIKIFVDTGFSGVDTLLKASIPTLRKGKYKLEDTKKYKVSDATISKEGEFFYISPRSSSFKMIYDVSGHAQTKFEFEIFVIILILSYLLSFKLVDYLADFKTIKNQSRIDIIFLLIFFVILFIPMSKINQAEISKQENRTLTKWQPLITKNGEINFNFGKNYDNWFNDRFNGRKLFISFNNDIQKKVSMYFYTKGTYIWNKTNNWLGSSSATNRNNSLSNEKNKLKIVQNISRIKKLCDENNIKLYILISPIKEEIYYSEIFDKKLKHNIHDLAIETIKYVKNETGVDIIYVYDELLELSKDELVFFKTDHHWTDAGAYIGYLALMNEIKKDFPHIYINKTDDFNYTTSNMVRVTPDYFYEGRTYNSLNLKDKKILDTQYRYFEYKNYKDVKITTTKHEKSKWVREYFYDDKYCDVYFYGDSFTLNLLQMLPFSFKYTKNIYIPTQSEKSDLALHEEDILENKANILILCFEGIDKLTNIYKDVK